MLQYCCCVLSGWPCIVYAVQLQIGMHSAVETQKTATYSHERLSYTVIDVWIKSLYTWD